MPPSTRPIARSRPYTGMTFVEIAVVMAILATAIMGLVSAIFSINQAQRFTSETQVARELAASMAERLQGVNWQLLHAVRDDPDNDTFTAQPWSWHRRRDGAGLPPLSEEDHSDGGVHNLITTGLVDRPTGLANLQVFLEYFNLESVDLASISSMNDWQERVSLTTNYWATAEGWANQLATDLGNPPDVSFADIENGIMFQIMLRWTSIAIGDDIDPLTMQPRRDRSLRLFLIRRR